MIYLTAEKFNELKTRKDLHWILKYEILNYEQWIYVISNKTKINIDFYFKEKYETYVDIFKKYQQYKHIKNLKLSDLGFNVKNTSIQYWLDRGFSLDTSKELFKNRQSTLKRVKNLNEVVQKQKLSRSLNPNLKEINYLKGSSNRYTFYLDKINPITNKNYSIKEAKNKIFLKQSKAGKNANNGKTKASYNNCIEFWIKKGFSKNEAILQLSERQRTFSLEKCILKHGEIEGEKIWKNRQIKWQNILNNKPEEEKEKILYKKLKNFNFYSLQSFNFFLKIEDIVKKIFDNFKFYYGKEEYFIYDKNHKRIFFYDLCIKELNLIVEFNGSHVHPNPLTRSENWINVFTKENVQQCENRDNFKNEIAKAHGFDVIVIWDTDDLEEKINLLSNLIINKIKTKQN
jgi:hypothetical protein